jgi:hypothetical protein
VVKRVLSSGPQWDRAEWKYPTVVNVIVARLAGDVVSG